MGAAAADGAFAASSCFRFKQDRVNVRKIFELQPRNFLADETFDCLQRRELLAIHEGKGVADILGAASASNAMHIILRVFGYIVIDNVAHAGDVEPAG